jgi:hypothetical protein
MHCHLLVFSRVQKDKNDEDTNGRWLLPQPLVKLEIQQSLQSEGTFQLCFPGHLTGLQKINHTEQPMFGVPPAAILHHTRRVEHWLL